MKKFILTTLILVFAFSAVTFSQTTNNQLPTYKPSFIVGDIYVIFTILDDIEIVGNEVEAFLEVKKSITGYLEEAQNKSLKVTDKITVNMPGHIAQNIITFLNRAKLKGNMAESYKRFVDGIIEASKAIAK
jgi:hypothetical protein